MKSVAFALILLAACGPPDRTRPGGGNGPDGGGGGGGSGSNDGCSAAAMFVYTVDSNNTFSQFDPGTKTFTDLGHLNCPAGGGATPFSMGVDRNAVAWVLYSDGELFRVDTTAQLACTATGWHSSNGLTQFGMGFSTNTAGGTDDSLFVAGGASVGASTAKLATLDTSAFTSTTVGTVQGWPELTGNSNGELWGWFPSDEFGTTMPSVQKLDKATGNPLTVYPLPSLQEPPTAWAFAFWGGDYWVFLATDIDTTTSIYQIDGASGQIKSTTPTNTRTIVGAGVSTCAPVVIE